MDPKCVKMTDGCVTEWIERERSQGQVRNYIHRSRLFYNLL